MKHQDTHLNIKIGSDLLAAVQRAAKKDGLKTSKWVRRLFERSLAARKRKAAECEILKNGA